MKHITLENIADGVAAELFAHELDKVVKNICDVNTEHKTKRQITLTFSFVPDESREETRIVVEAKSKLAQIKPCAKTAFIGKLNGKPAIFGQNTRQIDMFDNGVTRIDNSQKQQAVNNA
jgi:hypothetical protein